MQYCRGCVCRAVLSNWLVPGDVIVVLAGRATCDMVLLQGNCLVEESMLSGEVTRPVAVCMFKANLCYMGQVGWGRGFTIRQSRGFGHQSSVNKLLISFVRHCDDLTSAVIPQTQGRAPVHIAAAAVSECVAIAYCGCHLCRHVLA